MTHPYVFSMVLDTPEPSTLDFVAPDEQTYEYWLDGINALLGNYFLELLLYPFFLISLYFKMAC